MHTHAPTTTTNARAPCRDAVATVAPALVATWAQGHADSAMGAPVKRVLVCFCWGGSLPTRRDRRLRGATPLKTDAFSSPFICMLFRVAPAVCLLLAVGVDAQIKPAPAEVKAVRSAAAVAPAANEVAHSAATMALAAAVA